MRILNEWGLPLITQLVEDSGIDRFRDGISRDLREEKHPLLFMNSANDLQPICIGLQKFYVEQYQNLNISPVRQKL